jgi:tetratricopeptide (TPR) repeat protein
MPNNLQFKFTRRGGLASRGWFTPLKAGLVAAKGGLVGRALIWVLLAVVVIGVVAFPIYRGRSRSSLLVAEAADQNNELFMSQMSFIQIPTRLSYHTNGTVSVWFQGQADGVYRIDYADTKAATAEAMRWELAADNVAAVASGWTEWVDTGITNRPAPGEVKERYYRVVLKTVSVGTTQQLSTSPIPATGTVPVSGGTGSTTLLSKEWLKAFEDLGSRARWRNVDLGQEVEVLQQCARIGELVAGGKATEEALKTMLAGNLQMQSFQLFMNYASNLYRSGDRRDAQLVFEAMLQAHATSATKKQLGRCYLWLGKIHQDEGLEWKYQRNDPSRAISEFEAAVTNYLKAKDVVSSQDWVRVDSGMQAAACYRELEDQDKRREYLEQVLKDVNDVRPRDPARSLVVRGEMAACRDVATYLLGNSYYEEERWTEAADVYRQAYERLKQYLSQNPEQYRGQKMQLQALQTGLRWCMARQTETHVKGQVAQ